MSIKKAVLSGIVIVAFVIYSMQARHDQSEATVTAPTSLNTANPTDTTTTQPASPAPTMAPAAASQYKDGVYAGDPADAFYGNIQVQITVSGGKITNLDFLQYPNDRGTSVRINEQAMPLLAQEAIKAQSANVDGVSGATDTSQAFIQSLTSAVNRAKN